MVADDVSDAGRIRLIAAAALASELFGEDELERIADELNGATPPRCCFCIGRGSLVAVVFQLDGTRAGRARICRACAEIVGLIAREGSD